MDAAAPRAPTLLLIDDTPANLQVAVSLLQAYSFTVLTARDGESGLRRARLTSPDLILLDVQMPDLDGYEVCRRLKADPATASIPVIFMTVLSNADDKTQAFLVGGVDYVTKPIEATEVLARVRTHLALRSLQRRLERQNEELEERVRERTASLERAIAERDERTAEQERLLELVRAQSEQLRALTQAWVAAQRERDASAAATLREDVAGALECANGQLAQAEELTDAPEVRARLTTARAMLRPAAERAGSVQSELARSQTAGEAAANPLLCLSTREYEILQLIADGKANKEIGRALGLARTTVSTHRIRIMEKLGVPDLTSLIKLVMRHEMPPRAPDDAE